MASSGRGHRGRPRGIGQATPTFDQRAFTEAVGITIAAIAQACTIVSQGRSNDLQNLEAHHPPMVRGGVDSRVRTTMTTEGEVDVMRGIQDMGAGTKRKGDQSSSSSRKKPKASGSQGFQILGYQGQGRARVARRAGQMLCFHYQQPRHMRRDCPQRQGSRGLGTVQSQSAIGQKQIKFIPPHPSMGQRNRFQSQGDIQAPSAAQMGQSVGRGQVQSSQARTSGTQGRVYAVVPEAEHVD